MKCNCDPEYRCSRCRNCYACKHRYIYRRDQDQWWVRCPTSRSLPAYPDIETQERVRILRELEEATNMGGEKNEPKTTDLTSNQDPQTPPTPAETPATTEAPTSPDNL